MAVIEFWILGCSIEESAARYAGELSVLTTDCTRLLIIPDCRKNAQHSKQNFPTLKKLARIYDPKSKLLLFK